MNIGQPQFNCPRRLISLARAHDEWRHDHWGSCPSDFWPPAAPKPRTCSYCHGAHPDDVIPLLVAGWHLQTTDKPYKFYLRPPSGHDPVPSVEVYLAHWSQQQVMRADEVMRARRAFASASAEQNH
ncbi:hypothetical protein ACGYQ5_14435 [Burkholderia pseudomallei]